MQKFLEYAARCCEELGLLISVKNDEEVERVEFDLPLERLDYVDCAIFPLLDDSLVFEPVFPVIVPEENVPTLLEYITRVNSGSSQGAFIFDMDRRLLSFKVYNMFARDAEYEEIEEILQSMVYRGIGAVEDSEDDIADILEGAEDANVLYLRYKLRRANQRIEELESKK